MELSLHSQEGHRADFPPQLLEEKLYQDDMVLTMPHPMNRLLVSSAVLSELEEPRFGAVYCQVLCYIFRDILLVQSHSEISTLIVHRNLSRDKVTQRLKNA